MKFETLQAGVLRPPEVIAPEIVEEDLEAVLAQFREIANDLGAPGVVEET